MTRAELRKAIESVKYKPNWRFGACRYEAKPGYLITTEFRSTCIQTGEPINLLNNRHIPDWRMRFMTRRGIVKIIRQLIRTGELHEMHEWLKVDGKNVVNPHPKR